MVVAFSYAGFSQYIALRAPSPGIKIFLRRVPSRTPSASQGDQVRVGVACYTRINSINSWRRQIRVEILNGFLISTRRLVPDLSPSWKKG